LQASLPTALIQAETVTLCLSASWETSHNGQ
jgi:hypothetical protein